MLGLIYGIMSDDIIHVENYISDSFTSSVIVDVFWVGKVSAKPVYSGHMNCYTHSCNTKDKISHGKI